MSDEPPSVPDFSTARLRLRKLEIGDAPGLHEAYGHAETMRFWDAPPSGTLSETERRIGLSLSASPIWHATWAVLGRTDGRFLGAVNYHARQAWHARLAVGWILVPDAQKVGYAGEAMHALLDHCFDALHAHRIEAEIEPENVRSGNLARRLGFQPEGVLRDRLQVAGQGRSVVMWSLLRPEWEAARRRPASAPRDHT